MKRKSLISLIVVVFFMFSMVFTSVPQTYALSSNDSQSSIESNISIPDKSDLAASPNSFPFKRDFIKPVIESTPVTSATKNEAITISATVTDNSAVAISMLYFRLKGQSKYVPIPMNNEDDDLYVGIIPGILVRSDIEYYIEARDIFGNKAKFGPNTIKVTSGIAKLTTIKITHPASKLTYNVGDPLDITGLEVTGYYNDGSKKIETITAANISGFDSSVPRRCQALTVTVDGKKACYLIRIVKSSVVLNSISITKPANKLVYNVGDSLDITGLEVTGYYSDGSSKLEAITAANVTGFNSSAPAASQTLTVTVGGKTASYTVEIKAVPVVLNSIAITKPANKLVYNVGDSLDITGLEVTGYYSDGSSKVEIVTKANVTGFDSSAPKASQTLTVTVGGKTAAYTVEVKAVPVVLNSIAITKPASKLVYFVGEDLDITSLEVTGYYSDGSSKAETVTKANVTGFDSSAPKASQTLTVTVGGKSATYAVEIKAIVLESIAITKPAAKLVYFVDDCLDISGLEVTGYYNNGTSRVESLSNDNVTGFNSAVPAASQTLTVTVGGKSATYAVEIKAIAMESIAITKPATKLVYFVGDTLDISGLEVTGYYNNGTSRVESLSNDNVTGFNSAVPAANQTLTVTVGGKSATYAVEIKAIAMESIAITKPATKLVYFVGDALDISGLEVTGYYNNGTSRVESLSNDNVTGFNSAVPAASQTLTVTVGGKSATYTVEIKAAPVVLNSIAITKPADKLVYTVGDSLDISGLEVTGSYSDGSSKVEAITAADVSGFDSSAPAASLTLTVTVGGKSATYTVEIKAAESAAAALIKSVIANFAPVNADNHYTGYVHVYRPADGVDLNVNVDVNGNSSIDEDKAKNSIYHAAIDLIGEGDPIVAEFPFSEIVTGPESAALDLVNNGVVTEDADYKIITIANTPCPQSMITIFTACANINPNCSINFSNMVVDAQIKISKTSGRISSIDNVVLNGIANVLTPDYLAGSYDSHFECTSIPFNYGTTPAPVLQSIAITKPANKLVYTVGDSLDISGLEVTGSYSDGSSKVETITAADVSGFNSSAPAASQTLTVTFGGKTVTYTVEIKAAPVVLNSIAITKPANKLVYTVGDSLDISGLEVTGSYSDGSSKVETITTADVSGFNSSAPAPSQTLTVTVGGKTATYTVEIKAAPVVLNSIAITKPANKLVYTVGDSLDISGLEVTGSYSDGSSKVEAITAADVSGFNSSAPAPSQTLTVTVGGKTATYTVEIKAAPVVLESIGITHPADKLVYTVGDDLDISGLEITGYYSDGSSKVEAITTSNVTGFNSNAPMYSLPLTITVGGKMAQYTVDIMAPVAVTPESLIKAAIAQFTPVNGGMTLTGQVTGVPLVNTIKVNDVTVVSPDSNINTSKVAYSKINYNIDKIGTGTKTDDAFPMSEILSGPETTGASLVSAGTLSEDASYYYITLTGVNCPQSLLDIMTTAANANSGYQMSFTNQKLDCIIKISKANGRVISVDNIKIVGTTNLTKPMAKACANSFAVTSLTLNY